MNAVTTMPSRLPLAPLSTAQRNALRALPVEIVSGLRVLRDERAPHVSEPDLWDQVAATAIMLAADGWAGKALARGWSAHDLFGIGPDDSRDFAGLAVWLAGSELVFLSEAGAIATTPGYRLHYTRGGLVQRCNPEIRPILLWEFGRQATEDLIQRNSAHGAGRA